LKLVELWKGINSDSNLRLEHGHSGWKVLDEKKRMKTSDIGFETFEGK
jgi:hypothetical protein